MPKLPTNATQPEHQPEEDGARDSRSPKRAVQLAVLAALGRPPGLFGVAVQPLWENYFRVNVMVGPDVTSVRITHSYFMATGKSGDILSSCPPITRTYP